MLLAAEERPVPDGVCDLYVVLAGDLQARRPEAIALAAEARRAGVPAQIELAGRSVKGQFKQAARVQARYVAVLGDEGIELKDMESGEQGPVASASAVVARVLRGRYV
jgi:histidyl-tRNA synthetase